MGCKAFTELLILDGIRFGVNNERMQPIIHLLDFHDDMDEDGDCYYTLKEGILLEHLLETARVNKVELTAGYIKEIE